MEQLAEERRKELGLEKEEEESLTVVEDNESESNGPVPPAPESLVHQLVEEDVVKISWLPVAGADAYEIIRQAKGDEKWKRLSSSMRNPVYLDLHAPKADLVYRVRGNNKHGNGKWSAPLEVKLA